jgi:hypothetical protein
MLVMNVDEAFNAVDVGLLGAQAVVQRAHRLTDLIEQSWGLCRFFWHGLLLFLLVLLLWPA